MFLSPNNNNKNGNIDDREHISQYFMLEQWNVISIMIILTITMMMMRSNVSRSEWQRNPSNWTTKTNKIVP